jgi:hypothetical protein
MTRLRDFLTSRVTSLSQGQEELLWAERSLKRRPNRRLYLSSVQRPSLGTAVSGWANPISSGRCFRLAGV